jgi:hypothetical protein
MAAENIHLRGGLVAKRGIAFSHGRRIMASFNQKVAVDGAKAEANNNLTMPALHAAGASYAGCFFIALPPLSDIGKSVALSAIAPHGSLLPQITIARRSESPMKRLCFENHQGQG